MNTNTLSRLLRSYTCYNILLYGLLYILSQYISPLKTHLRPVVIANSLLIATVVTLILSVVPLSKLIEYIQILWKDITPIQAISLHFITHYLPLVVFGIGTNVTSTVIALFMFSVWYATYRDELSFIYLDGISLEDYDRIVITSMILVLVYSLSTGR